MKAALEEYMRVKIQTKKKVDKSKEQKGRGNRLEVKIESGKENFKHEDKRINHPGAYKR